MTEIVLKNIFKSYDQTEVIHGVDLKVESGKFLVLVGPSGCGKSTLLRIIAGLERITSGEILIEGNEVSNIPASERGLAMVFQSYALYPHMSVFKNMAFSLENLKIDKKTIEEKVNSAAKLLQIEDYLQRKPKALSGGQRQRVAIGRAIVRDPKAFLFDEPLSNLDAELRVTMRKELSALHEKIGGTMIYVTHDQTEALTFADQVVVMNFGQVLQVGTPVELFERPTHTFVGHFIGSPGMNVLPVTVEGSDVQIAGVSIRTASDLNQLGQGTLEIGVRPEFVSFVAEGIPGTVETVMDVGRHRVVKVKLDGLEQTVNAIVEEGDAVPAGQVQLQFEPSQTRLYEDGWVVAETQG